jgi:tetratricopeptide (TPR) repeat protein
MTAESRHIKASAATTVAPPRSRPLSAGTAHATRTSSPVEAEVLRLRTLMEKGQFAAALAGAEALLERVPENRDVLYLIAVNRRYLNRIPEALAALERCARLHPGYSRLYQERGHCYIAARNPGPALEAYLAAVRINPALPASWNAIQVLFRSAGRSDDTRNAAAHLAELERLPAPVVTATGLFADGEIHAAEHVIREFLLSNPDHVEGMRLLAQIGMKLEIYDDPEFLLESVLVFAPGYHAARYEYVQALLARHKSQKALEEARVLLDHEPENRNYRTIYATACVALGSYDEALAVYRKLLDEAPRAAGLHLSIAHALKTVGLQSEAVESYRAAAAAAPGYGDAYWSLANLKTYRFTDAELEEMHRHAALETTTPVDRYHLCFALGKALEDRGEYRRSFEFYERGNELKLKELRFGLEPIERTARAQISLCTRPFFAARAGFGCPQPDPIFIVGLPRAGSTLLEQILASHSKVEGTLELSDIPRLVNTLQGRVYDESNPPYPGVLASLDAAHCARLGEIYLADTQIYRTGRPFFIDKMPNNFRHIGLIHLILPNAKIIDARRDPMACCFSNFKQLFASGQEFTYGLDNIARYYRCYVELMDHWNEALPGKILRVNHEDVVEDLDANVCRILEFCGLEFEPACLEFYKTERKVRTASSEQVRRPIFKEGVDQWRKFEPWLEPLKTALGTNRRDNDAFRHDDDAFQQASCGNDT